MSEDVWTEERIRAYGARMPGVDAVIAVYGCSTRKAYDLLAAGDVDFPVLRRGQRYVVATTHVLRLLGLDEKQAA